MSFSKISIALAFAAASLWGAGAEAQTVVADSYQGWFDSTGSHSASNTNTYTGLISPTEYRSFYVFSLANAQQASQLTINFTANNGSYTTNSTSETVGLFDYTGSTATLMSDQSGATSTFADLGTGTSYGSYTITGSSSMTMPGFSITLNQSALASYNSAVSSGAQYFALGAALTSISGTQQQAFWSGSSTQPAATLTISAVPEPATWGMMIAGFGMIGTALRRQRRAMATA